MAKVTLGGIVGQVRSQIAATAMRAIPRSNDRVSHHKRDVVSTSPAAALHSNSNVGEWHVIVTDTDFRALREITIESNRKMIVFFFYKPVNLQ